MSPLHPGTTYHRIHPNLNWSAAGREDIVVVDGSRDAREFSFHSDSIWNIGFGANATFEADTSGTATHQMLRAAGFGINSARWSVSVGRAKTTDPVRTVTCDTTADVYQIRIPDSLTATGGSDGWVTVIDENGYTAREFYAAVKHADGHWSTRYPLIITDLRGHGLAAGRRASATSQMGGLILASQFAKMTDTHMLGIAIPASALKPLPVNPTDGDNVRVNSTGGGSVWPAGNADNQNNIPYNPAGLTAMGAVYGIPPSVNLSSLGLTTPEGMWIGRCLQNNGAVVIAQSATIALAIEPIANQARVEAARSDWRILGPRMRRLLGHQGGSLNSNREPTDPSVILGSGAPRRVVRLTDLA